MEALTRQCLVRGTGTWPAGGGRRSGWNRGARPGLLGTYGGLGATPPDSTARRALQHRIQRVKRQTSSATHGPRLHSSPAPSMPSRPEGLSPSGLRNTSLHRTCNHGQKFFYRLTHTNSFCSPAESQKDSACWALLNSTSARRARFGCSQLSHPCLLVFALAPPLPRLNQHTCDTYRSHVFLLTIPSR